MPRRTSVGREVRAIRRSLSSIAAAIQRLAPILETVASVAAQKHSRRGRTLKLSPARRVALKLQGQYMGYLRGLKPRQRVRVKDLRTKKGIRPAIAFARRLANR